MNEFDINSGKVISFEFHQNKENTKYNNSLIHNIRAFLEKKNIFFSKEELLKKGYEINVYPAYSSLKKLIENINEINRAQDPKKYVDVTTTQIVLPFDGVYYSKFFFLKLMQIQISEVDDYLYYQSRLYVQETGKDFIRFVHVCLRENFDNYPADESRKIKIYSTIQEWIEINRTSKTEHIEEKNQHFTNAQIVIVYKLKEKEHKIIFHQDNIRFIRFICNETGRNINSIKDFNKRYEDNSGFIHGKTKQDLEDYKKVKEHFESVDSKQIVQVIDLRIEELEKWLKAK